MADREAFEVWARDLMPTDESPRKVAWAAWQAATAQTARECAEICDGLTGRKPWECAQAIRARFGLEA